MAILRAYEALATLRGTLSEVVAPIDSAEVSPLRTSELVLMFLLGLAMVEEC